jgi:hypothetical protein
MAKDPAIGNKGIATVTGLKGKCNAGHFVGEQLEICCHNTGGLCGFFYDDIFPNPSVMQFGGKYPWGDRDVLEIG